jgi:hypothetical protein
MNIARNKNWLHELDEFEKQTDSDTDWYIKTYTIYTI